MAESKSNYFSYEINAHSEKYAKFGPISINRLAFDTECRRAPEQPCLPMSAFGGKADII
jgi:hypothetical protein